MSEADGLTPQQRRQARTRSRLRAALEKLATDPMASITAAAVAREAGVGRNVLYVGHADILSELRAVAEKRADTLRQKHDDADASNRKIRDLENRLALIATENASLLRRAREAEARLARSEQHNAQLLRQLADAKRPASLRPEPIVQPEQQS